MAVVKWHDGEKWVSLYDNEIYNLKKRIGEIAISQVDVPISDLVRLDIAETIVDEDTPPDEGSGKKRHAVARRTFETPATMTMQAAIAALARDAHKHEIVANSIQPIKLCQCQCQCDCFGGCSHSVQTPVCTFNPDCDCNCDCHCNCNCSDGGSIF